MRQKRCKGCGGPFTPRSPMQCVCSGRCETLYAREHLAQGKPLARASTLTSHTRLARRTALAQRPLARQPRAEGPPTRAPCGDNSRRSAIHAATAAFNAFIRERDSHKPCVSCGRWHALEWHAGHYMSVGARSELRFDEANVHRQCSYCNTNLAGNRAAYRERLIQRVGAAEVRRLEGHTAPRKWSYNELREIATRFAERLARLRLSTDPVAPHDSECSLQHTRP